MSYILLYFDRNINVAMLDGLRKSKNGYSHLNSVSKRVLKHNVYVLLAGLMFYILNETVLKVWLKWSWIHNYLNDSIAGILFLACARIVLIYSHPKKFSFVFSLGLILSAGVFWEYITPLYCKTSVSDVIDIVAYVAGELLWYVSENYMESEKINQ